jgi:hypothetical protein
MLIEAAFLWVYELALLKFAGHNWAESLILLLIDALELLMIFYW